MAYATFPTTMKPDIDSTNGRKPLKLSAPFGDGYSQELGDGILPFEDSWSLSYSNRPTADILVIKTFLDNLMSGTSRFFIWTAPDELVAYKWKLEDDGYKFSNPGGDNRSISFKISKVNAA